MGKKTQKKSWWQVDSHTNLVVIEQMLFQKFVTVQTLFKLLVKF